MGRVDWHRGWQLAAVRMGARAGLSSRRAPLVVGALACTAGVAVAGSIWLSSASDAPTAARTSSPTPEWDLDSAEVALAQGRLVLAQLGADPRAEAPVDASAAPTLAEVIDLPIRRVATTRITVPAEDGIAAVAPAKVDPVDVDPPPPAPDLEALLGRSPSALFPAPAGDVPVVYASLPEAAVPERFAMRPPRLPLLARLETPPPLAGDAASWAPAEEDGEAFETDATAAIAPVDDVAQEGGPEEIAAGLAHVPPPPRPAGLGASQPVARPAPSSEAEAEATGEAPGRERTRTLAGLLRAAFQGDRMPGVAEAADGATPTACLPEPLREVLADVAREFGTVTLVSTQILNTANHYVGSARDRYHRDCEAADFRVDADTARVVRWLRGRPGVGGVAAYRNGVVHVDLDRAVAAQLRSEQASRRGSLRTR